MSALEWLAAPVRATSSPVAGVPVPDGQVAMDILAISASGISFILGLTLVLVYFRRIRIDFDGQSPSAVLDVLIRSLCFSVPCNFIFCIGAILQLFGRLEPFCPASLIGIEMLWVPQVMLETGFFVFVALEASGRAIDVKWSKRLTIIVLISCVLITVLVFWLLAETTKGLHYGTSLPWCWIPGSNTDGESSESAERDKAVLTALRLISAYLWLLIADVVGVMAFIYFLFRLRRYI
jgi:hypothetical protein